MSQSIRFLRSTTPGQKPVQLSSGQIAFNLVDKLMFVGDGSNLITDLAGNATPGVAGKGFFTTDLDISSAEDAAKAYTDAQINALVDGAPGLLDTLNELAAALGDDSDFASTITNSIAAVQAAVAAEAARAAAAEAALSSDLSNEISRASAAEAANASAIAAEASRAQSAEASITSSLNAEVSRAQAEEAALAGAIASEVSRALAAENLLDSRLDDVEENLNTEIVTVFETEAAVYADGFAPYQDPEYRQGWYFTNATAGDKINWYFFDGMAETSTLGSFTAYAVFTLDSVADVPFLGVYTKPTGSGDAGSWYHSRQVWIKDSNFAVTAGKTYLIHIGADPKVHPELTRIPLVKAFNTVGDQGAAEQILTVALNTDSSAGAGNYKFLVDSLGVKTENGYDRKNQLRFRQATVNDLNFDFGSF